MFYQLAKPGNDWKDKLNVFISLAPVTRLADSKSDLFVALAPIAGPVETLMYSLKVYHILDGWQSDVMQTFCKFFGPVCQAAEGFLITQDPRLENKDRFNVYMGHFPTGASIQSLIHYAQMITTKTWPLYDWGKKRN